MLRKILMLKFDIKYFLSKESGYHMISLRTYSYLKKIKLFLDMYLCSKGRVFSVVVHEILLVQDFWARFKNKCYLYYYLGILVHLICRIIFCELWKFWISWYFNLKWFYGVLLIHCFKLYFTNIKCLTLRILMVAPF